ncbi:hypothetical protein LTR66_003028 [Elasticomyces elasticus]|nr:hypothetical protein LTR66_003028 [Elasticomyces elasticus]
MDISTPLDPSNLFSAKGLVAVITGGGGGIGLALAATVYRSGAHKVYILGRRREVLQSSAQSLDATGSIVIPLQCDITSSSSIAEAAKAIDQDVGYVDVLINNAGIVGPDHRPANDAATIAELQAVLQTGGEDDWARTFATNTTAIVTATAAFLPLLDAANQRRGWEAGKKPEGRRRDTAAGEKNGVDSDDERRSQIISVTSIAAFNRGITAGLAYNASKAGATSLGKALATLLGPYGIRSNIIAPGIYPSDMNTEAKDKFFPANKIPASRAGDFNDIAGVTLYLVGKAGAYVDGTVMLSDGGRLGTFPATY